MDSQDSGLEMLYELLLAVDYPTRNHYNAFLAAIEFQRSAVDRMQVLAQRYSLLVKGVPSKRVYPEESSQHVEEDVRVEFHIKRGQIDESNYNLNSSLMDLRKKYYILNEYIKRLEASHISYLDANDSTRPPVVYFVEIFSDFLKYFTKVQSTINCFAALLAPGNLSSLTTYKKLLNVNEDFKDHYAKSLAYCSTLHNNLKT